MKATEIIFFLKGRPWWLVSFMLILAIGQDIQMIVFGLIALGMSIATIDRKRIRIIK